MKKVTKALKFPGKQKKGDSDIKPASHVKTIGKLSFKKKPKVKMFKKAGNVMHVNGSSIEVTDTKDNNKKAPGSDVKTTGKQSSKEKLMIKMLKSKANGIFKEATSTVVKKRKPKGKVTSESIKTSALNKNDSPVLSKKQKKVLKRKQDVASIATNVINAETSPVLSTKLKKALKGKNDSESTVTSDINADNSPVLSNKQKKALKRKQSYELKKALKMKQLIESTATNATNADNSAAKKVTSKGKPMLKRKTNVISVKATDTVVNKKKKKSKGKVTAESIATNVLNANDSPVLSKKKKRALKKKQESTANKATNAEKSPVLSKKQKKALKRKQVMESTATTETNADDSPVLSKKQKKVPKKKGDVDSTAIGAANTDQGEKNTLANLKMKRKQQGLETSSKSSNPTLNEQMSEQLKSSRFRWLNEQLYSSSSDVASKYFKDNPQAFEAYHEGFQKQVAQWPLNPLEWIIDSIASSPKGTVIADMGCGEARLADSLPQFKVHSFDLIASKSGVVACDMAHTPLLVASVDIVVFCLSLMGTNLNDFILEANRILKLGGILKIAEVESRFADVDNFTSELQHFGFQLKKKDFSKELFYFMDFKKVRNVSRNDKLPVVTLEPCLYKKR